MADTPIVQNSPPTSIAAALGRKCAEFTDAAGVKHAAPPLTLGDLADLEHELGPMSEWGSALSGGSVKAMIIVLWHSLRKEGLAPDKVRKHEWAYTQSDVGEMLLGGDFQAATAIVLAVLENSGLVVGSSTGRPMAAAIGSSPSERPSPAASLLTTSQV